MCPFCKKEILDHTQFCPECGQPVTSAESTGGASATYWNSVEKETERDNKIHMEIRHIAKNLESMVGNLLRTV